MNAPARHVKRLVRAYKRLCLWCMFGAFVAGAGVAGYVFAGAAAVLGGAAFGAMRMANVMGNQQMRGEL